MFERFKGRSSDANGTSGTAVADRPVRDRTNETTVDDRRTATDRPAATRPVPTRDHMHTARARQREEYGGINWGAAFFGWLVAVVMIAYYCGGYVAGRMSRFDGARQGFGAWLFGIAVTVLLAVAAIVLGSEYNVLEQLNLPSLPVGESTLTTGGAIALAAVVLGTLLAAVVGGKAGERYHRKVDRVGFVD